MSPKHNEKGQRPAGVGIFPPSEPGEEIVISGIAGRFPDSDNLTIFQENLFNKVDLISGDDRRWKMDHPEVPRRTGKINNVGKFDSQFFGVDFKQAHTMDPMCRMLLEHAYEAVVDAGVNPRQLRGTNTGVFVGACFSESENTWFYGKLQVNGFGITGCSRAMLANRISYWLGANGPSYTVDSACSSSLFALDHAYRAIRTGQCDAAIVGGSNLCLHPYVSLQFSRLGVLSPDGRCKSFDASANGYARSEAISAVFLQKAKNAKRIYAEVVYTKTNCDGYKEQGITFPSSIMQRALMEQFYQECQIPSSILSYVEAHGTGTTVGDPEELNALDKVFCPGRTTPLRIGSIKSNLGHSEPASGLCSIAKMVIAMESGYIPPNLNYNRPREGVKALEDGRIKVVTDLTPWEGGYVGINSFGFGGANAHVLLKSHTKEKIDDGASNDDLPRLVAVSGRTEEAVLTLLDDLLSRPVDVEYISLFHGIHAKEITGHLYRGYTILPPRGLPAADAVRDVQHCPDTKRPVWFVFSGIGSQWAGMGEALLKIPIFAKAVNKCDAVLKPHGIDIIDILTNKNPNTFDNIVKSYVGIAAVQIGLVDVLTSLEIVPNNVIGHSTGELGCAYADGCLTAEQMVLAAYSRGLASIETDTIHRSMSAVRLGYEDLKDLYPGDIELAGQKLLGYLKNVIPDPKPRSPKWLSTSVPRNSWTTSAARLCSAEYHTNNFLSPVLFEETSSMIPNNAIVIEIAPYGFVETILRRSLNEGVTKIALTERGNENNVEVLLQAIGKIYEAGVHPQLSNLYAKVNYPVSRGTPKISPLIRWEHSDDWYVTSYRTQARIKSGEKIVQVTLSDEDFEWMAGHVIDGRNLIPATGYLTLIWETIGMLYGQLYTEVPVVFEDIKFLRATTIPKEGAVELMLMIQRGSGRFEVIEGDTAVVTGIVRPLLNPARECFDDKILTGIDEKFDVSSRDVYKELRLRGYNYSGVFRGIREISLSGKKGRINWTNNWVAFMDNMLQMMIIGKDTRGLFVPTAIQKVVIDTSTHLNQVHAMPDDDKAFDVVIDKDLDVIVCGSIQIKGLRASAIARKKPIGDPVLEDFKFVAHRDRTEMPLSVITRIATHIALENQRGVRIKTVEIIGESDDASLENLTSPTIQEILGDLPLIQADVNIFAPADKLNEDALPSATISDLKKLTSDFGALLAVGHKLLARNDTEKLKLIQASLDEGGFFLAREPLNADKEIFSTIRSQDLEVILEKRTDKELIILLRKKEKRPKISTIVKVNGHEFSWLPKLQAALKAELERESYANRRILVVSEGDCESGVMGLINCLRKEPGGEVIRGFFIQDLQAPEFTLENPFYSEQVKLDLSLNVLRPGKIWGSYRFFKLDSLAPKPVYHTRVSQLVRGDLSSLKWVEGTLQLGSNDDNMIEIYYSSLNFRDIMVATGKLANEVIATSRFEEGSVIGIEFTGRNVEGRPVMGMAASGAISNFYSCDAKLIWPVPDNWTLEDAATVPVVYSTAYYALIVIGEMKSRDKVLIHAGSGGVGQAAITLALSMGCEVFTTVGTAQKREFIRTQFPQINEDHIGNSRDTSFEQLILTKTKGHGVDIVLNSLAEEKLQASVRCLARGGRFLEIGKFDLAANNSLGMDAFLNEISFHGVLLDKIFAASDEKKMQLHELISEGIKSGAVKPLVRTVFPADQVEAAFRYMAAGKHIGKVILKVRDENDAALPLALPRYYCSEDRSYLILGGLGGFGLELVDWLVLRGAKKIVLTSRKGISNGYQRMRIRTWQSYGVEIVIVVGKDASTYEGCKAILESAAALGPVDAIFNLAVVLKDALYENQTPETFEESLRVKAWATKQLDKLSRKLCPDLRKFVVFSSVSCGRGNAGQTNYGMANSIMERICENRVAENLPGLAIEWGAIGDVGLVAEMQEDDKEVVIGGTLQQKISSCLEELDGFLQQNSPVVSSMVVAEKRAGGAGAINIIDTVVNIMGLKDLKTVSLHTPLAELGMDSIMAVEIKQTLEREFELFLTAQDIRGLNFAKLEEMSIKDADSKNNCRKNVVNDSEELAGIKVFMRVIGVDELIPDICIPLQTKAESGREEVFIIPGIEGTYNVFQTLSGKLKSPTTCLQLGGEVSELSSVDEIADCLLLQIKEKIKERRTFVVVGYSFGSLVAIELVRRLEAEGLNGRLVLIDGSSDYMKALASQTFNAESDVQLQSNILSGIMGLMNATLVSELLVEFQNCDTWEKKLDAFVSQTSKLNSFTFSPQVQRSICSSVYQRIKAVFNYDSSALPPLNTPITLLKPRAQAISSMSEDYGLRKVTCKNVEIHYTDGNHVTMLDDDICATIINGDLIEDEVSFKKCTTENDTNIAPIITRNVVDRA